jgi:sulfopyruvate decarboxylase TPP-binding subunit
MLDGPSVVREFRRVGITHVVWLPDSELGTWDAALTGPEGLPLVRVCREGEAFAVAAGLHLGGKQPIILIQCTGLFEAGDALRNIIHDFELPLFFVVGVRNYYAHQAGKTRDSCPIYTEPILRAWNVPYVLLDRTNHANDLAAAYERARTEGRAGAALIAE